MPHTAIKHALRLPLCDTHAHTPPMPTSSCQPTPFPQTHVQSILYTHATKSSAASAAATIGSLLPSRCQPVAVHGCTCEGQGKPNRTPHSGMLDDLPRISTAKSSLLHSCLLPPHTMESLARGLHTPSTPARLQGAATSRCCCCCRCKTAAAGSDHFSRQNCSATSGPHTRLTSQPPTQQPMPAHCTCQGTNWRGQGAICPAARLLHQVACLAVMHHSRSRCLRRLQLPHSTPGAHHLPCPSSPPTRPAHPHLMRRTSCWRRPGRCPAG